MTVQTRWKLADSDPRLQPSFVCELRLAGQSRVRRTDLVKNSQLIAKAAHRSPENEGKLKSDDGYHYVYILQSCSHPNQTYIGRTRNLRQRLSEHNTRKVPHTSKFSNSAAEICRGLFGTFRGGNCRQDFARLS